MNSARRGFGNADDAAILGDNDFGFDGMAFLLAGIPDLLFPAWPLDGLFSAVYDQGLCLLATDPNCAFDPQNSLSQCLDPVQRPADGRLVGLIQASHEILRDGASVQNQKDKEVILNSTYTPRTTGAVL
jgi:hypothetical protein